jgi:hypothetical protein
MAYLLPAEYAVYGLSAETSDAWVAAASAMIDAYCKRPGLLAQSYTERLRVGRRSQSVRLSYGPLVAVTAMNAHFGAACAQADGLGEGFFAEVASAFGVANSWVPLDVTQLDVCSATGEVTLPCNLLGVAMREVEVTYTAGFAAAPVPVQIACAQIVKNAQTQPGLNVKSSSVDTLRMEYFSDQLLDAQTRALLQPFVAERLS